MSGRWWSRSYAWTQGSPLFEAVNGSDAVDLAARERPQVVVTDIMMPRMASNRRNASSSLGQKQR
jgi:CheY-like chemotaxis protein